MPCSVSQARAFLTVSQLGMPNKVIIWVFSGLNRVFYPNIRENT
jgi:hypothetical protein